MAAKGYPGDYQKNTPIAGLDRAKAMEGVEVFHAGTQRDGDRLLAVGGRVLSVTARGKTVSDAQKRVYEAVRSIDWPGGFYRNDIGWRAIAREKGRP
jgi:phosphoribosylamine--glycine ligase